MGHDDMSVVAYKVMRGVDAARKRGVDPNWAYVRGLVGNVNGDYLADVAEALSEKGYVSGIEVTGYYDGERDVHLNRARLTLDGDAFLSGNSAMARARDAAGSAFDVVLEAGLSLLARAVAGGA